jgi:hypothetical protein
VEPHCSFCGTFTGPFSEVEGLFTVLSCVPCLEVRQAQPDTLLGLHDPGDPWLKWACPIEGCGQWFLAPWDLEWHTAAEHPGWTATYELLQPTRTSASGSCIEGFKHRRRLDPIAEKAPRGDGDGATGKVLSPFPCRPSH